MNILIIVGGAFLALGATVILIISCLPSPMVTQLVRSVLKRSADVKSPSSVSSLSSPTQQDPRQH